MRLSLPVEGLLVYVCLNGVLYVLLTVKRQVEDSLTRTVETLIFLLNISF